MVDVGNVDTKLEDYFKLSFIVTKLVNLNAMLGVILDYILYDQGG